MHGVVSIRIPISNANAAMAGNISRAACQSIGRQFRRAACDAPRFLALALSIGGWTDTSPARKDMTICEIRADEEPYFPDLSRRTEVPSVDA